MAHQRGANVAMARQPGETAGHHPPAAGGIARHEDAQGEGQGDQLPVDDRGRGGEFHHFLPDIIHRSAGHGVEQSGALIPVERGAGRERGVRQESGADYQIADPCPDMIALARLAAPPGRDVGQDQVGPQHRLRQLRQEGGEGARFDHARPRPIADHQAATRAGIVQVGHADARLAVERQRIEEAAVHPAPQAVDALQPLNGAYEQAAIRHDQVVAFYQQQAEIAGKMGLLGIALVEAARRQQADTWIGALAIGGQAPAQFVKEGRKPTGIHRAQQVAGRARQSEPVFQRIAHAHGRAHPIGQHTPFAGRTPADIGGVEMEMMAARWRRAGHHPPIMGAAGDDAGGQLAVAHQRLGGVDVADDPLQQVGALNQPAFDMRPFRRIDQQRHRAERPGPLFLVPGVAEGHAKVDRLPCDMIGQNGGIGLRLGGQLVQHGAPAHGHGWRCARKQVAHRGLRQIGVRPA